MSTSRPSIGHIGRPLAVGQLKRLSECTDVQSDNSDIKAYQGRYEESTLQPSQECAKVRAIVTIEEGEGSIDPREILERNI